MPPAIRQLRASCQGDLPITPRQDDILTQLFNQLAGYRVSSSGRPYARVRPEIRSWLRARVGFTVFRGITRRQFPFVRSLLKEAIRLADEWERKIRA